MVLVYALVLVLFLALLYISSHEGFSWWHRERDLNFWNPLRLSRLGEHIYTRSYPYGLWGWHPYYHGSLDQCTYVCQDAKYKEPCLEACKRRGGYPGLWFY